MSAEEKDVPVCRGADFSYVAAHVSNGLREHADRDGLRGVMRAVFIDRGGHAPGEPCPNAELSPHDPHAYWCAAPVPGQLDGGEPCTCGAEGRVIPPGKSAINRSES